MTVFVGHASEKRVYYTDVKDCLPPNLTWYGEFEVSQVTLKEMFQLIPDAEQQGYNVSWQIGSIEYFTGPR